MVQDSEVDPEGRNKSHFQIDHLSPKTQYRFYLELYYPKLNEPFIWPSDARYVFETLGDVPSMPGKPDVKHESGEVYHISWEPSKENGAPIEQYSLEALKSQSLRAKRSTTEIISGQTTNSTIASMAIDLDNELDTEEEGKEDQWTVFYSGPNHYWIAKGLHPIHLYKFRVRARNSYGWSSYSSNSEPVSEPFMSVHQITYQTIAILVSVGFLVMVVIGICIYFGEIRRQFYW